MHVQRLRAKLGDASDLVETVRASGTVSGPLSRPRAGAVNFATRLFLGAVAILLVSVTALVLATDVWQRRDLEASLAAELEREARSIAVAMPHDSAALNSLAHRFGTAIGRRVTFIDRDGHVLGDSDFDDASLRLLENHRAGPRWRPR